MRKENCNIEALRQDLKYEADTGSLHWVKSGSGRNLLNPAGSLHKASNSYKLVYCGKQYPLHRIVWVLVRGFWPKNEIDHIDGNELNNRIENLREATPRQNSQNRSSRAGSTSRYRGVYLHSSGKCWVAAGGEFGKQSYLGVYKTEELAAAAYNTFAKNLYGEFSRLNLIKGA